MARREAPIDPDAPAQLRELAGYLRELRDTSGLTYQALAKRVDFSAPTMSRAGSGKMVPSAEVVNAFADACGVNNEQRGLLVRLRAAAVAAVRRQRSFPADTTAPLDREELRRGLLELYQAAGRPSLRDLQDVSGISRSTLHRILSKASDNTHVNTDPRRLVELGDELANLAHPDDRAVWRRLRPPWVERYGQPDFPVTTPDAFPGGSRGLAKAALLRLTQRASQLKQRLADGELTADEAFVSLLLDLQDGVDEARQHLESMEREQAG